MRLLVIRFSAMGDVTLSVPALRGVLQKNPNLSITMVLGGLWHGAAWNFILWGCYQGAILSIHRYFTKGKINTTSSRIIYGLKIILFFAVTCYGWLLFRANSVSQITEFTSVLIYQWSDMAVHMKRPTLAAILSIPLLFLFEVVEYKSGDTRFYRRLPVPIAGGVVAYMLLMISMGLSNEPIQFIYFQF